MSKTSTSLISAAGQLSNVGHLQQVGQLTAESIAGMIRDDVSAFEKYSRIVAYGAIRIGLMMMFVRDTSTYGSLGKFMDEHLAGLSRSSLYNYMKVAQHFAEDAKLVDKKNKLTNGDKVAPILETQLELFADPQTIFEGALRKVIKWVADRGLSEIYRDIAAGEKKRFGGHLSPGPDMSPEAVRKREIEDQEKRALDVMQWLATDAFFAVDETAGRRLLAHEVTEQHAHTVSLLSHDTLAKLERSLSHGVETVKHILDHVRGEEGKAARKKLKKSATESN